jgi:1,4-dihydroxy-2-naphthoate octaprenyltransferase
MNAESLKIWVMAIRPKTLPAAVGPVAVGSAVAYADQKFMLLPTICCLFGAILLQIGVNLANDYFDFKNNIDSDERLGPTRVTQSGLIAPSAVKGAMILSLVLAGLVFVYLALVGGLPIIVLGAASIAAALAYSGGPYPLASHGLGELFVFLFFGLVAVGGTYYIQAQQLTATVLLAAVPPGLLITAIMIVNNLRDIVTDKKAGKNTMAVRLGRQKTITLYRALIFTGYLMPLILIAGGTTGTAVLLPLATLPMAVSLAKRVETDLAGGLNELLASTARLSLLFSLLFAAGLAFY